MPESGGSSRFHVTAGCGDGLWSRAIVRRTKFRALGGPRVYKEAIRGSQNGNSRLTLMRTGEYQVAGFVIDALTQTGRTSYTTNH